MKHLEYWKIIVAAIIGAAMTYGQVRFLSFRLWDALMITAAVTITWSFTFVHTMLGQNAASGGSVMDQYQKISRDMRYNIREDKGFITETLLVGVIELVAGAVLILMK